jgi:Uma2 family endonuclease
VPQLARRAFTYAAYVRLEADSPVKHEFLDGVVYAMAGGSPEHAAIAARVIRSQPSYRSGEAAPLESVDCTLPVDVVYEDPLA